MPIHFFIVLFFLFSAFSFFAGLKKYHMEKTQSFAKLYFFIMTLFSIVSFLYGVYYYSYNVNLLSFIYFFEMCSYVLIFTLILHCISNILTDKKPRYINIFYLISFFIILFLLNYFYSNEIFQKNDIIYVFQIYSAVIIFFTLVFIFAKSRKIQDERYKKNIYFFAGAYTVLSFIFLYVYSDNHAYLHYSLKLEDISIFIITSPMVFMHRIINNFNFGKILPENIVIYIMNSMNESVIITDIKGDIVYFNKRAEDVIGLHKKNIAEIFANKDTLDEIEEQNSIEAYINSKEGVVSSIVVFSNVRDSFEEISGKIFIFQSIRQLIEARHRLERVKRKLENKIKKRTKELEEYNEKLKNEINDRVSIEYQIRDIFCYDTLTALYNRSYFIQNLERTLFDEAGDLHALMFIDLDGFKSVNDSLGHSYGDDVLISISNRLRHLYKYKNVIISRFGGDEFVILFKNVPNETFVALNAQSILEIVREPIYFDDAKIYVSASIGISMYPKDGCTRDELTKSADAAMYKSKESGKNQYKFFQEQYRIDIQREYDLTHSLLNAINDNELILYYQPQITIIDGVAKVKGFESLIRWKKDKQLIPPGVFIPVAEKTNIISDMGRWIVFEACSQGKKWREKYGKNFNISINLSANQIMNPMIYDEISTTLLRTGIDPESVEFEITETTIVKDIKKSMNILGLLKELGVRISVDDFGTKYATFSYLKNLPIDKIKIDISFIRGIGKNKIDEGIILSLISLSKGLGVDIIAEGVETKEELMFLLDNGCNNIQGFLFFPPMSANDLEEREILNYSNNKILNL